MFNDSTKQTNQFCLTWQSYKCYYRKFNWKCREFIQNFAQHAYFVELSNSKDESSGKERKSCCIFSKINLSLKNVYIYYKLKDKFSISKEWNSGPEVVFLLWGLGLVVCWRSCCKRLAYFQCRNEARYQWVCVV